MTKRVTLKGGADRSDTCLTIVPVPSHLSEAAAAPRFASLVFLTRTRPCPGELGVNARDRWELTAAEIRVLEQLLNGRGPRDIATDLGVAISTVRTDLKRLYAKTNTTARRELLAKVSNLCCS